MQFELTGPDDAKLTHVHAKRFWDLNNMCVERANALQQVHAAWCAVLSR